MDCRPTRLLRPWDFPDKNTGVGCHFLLQEIFQTQGLNPCLLHCRQRLYCLSHQGTSKIMVTSFKRSHACTATLSAPNPAAGHHRPTPLLETPGHSRASLAQSLVVLLLLSPGSWCAQVSVCDLQESISQSCVSSGCSMVGLMATSSNRAHATPRSAAPRAPPPRQPTADPSNTVLSQSLRGLWVLVHTRFV